jgi:hypothetical protein
MTTFRWLLLIGGVLLIALVPTLGYALSEWMMPARFTERTPRALPPTASIRPREAAIRIPSPSINSVESTPSREERVQHNTSPEKPDSFLTPEGKARRAEAEETFARTLIEDTKRELRDSSWAARTEADIHGALAELSHNLNNTALTVRSVQCGSIRCSLEADVSERSAVSAFVNKMTNLASLPRTHIRRSNAEGGKSVMRVVFARPGYLPTGVAEDS